MATHSDSRFEGAPGDRVTASVIDRWIYVFMATFFVVTTLVGFVPDSLMKIDMVAAGERPPFPPVLHVHAVVMGMWLLLLLTQTTLMATGNRAHHMKLGVASFLLAPAIVITGIVLVPTIYGQAWNAVATASGPELAEAQAALARRGNIALRQLQGGILFATFVILALRARKTDAGFHKRMIILATVVPLGASIARLTWLPTSMPASPVMLDVYTLVWIMPMFLWDLRRLGHIHRAYRVWLALWVPSAIAVGALWGSDWWQDRVPALMGYA